MSRLSREQMQRSRQIHEDYVKVVTTGSSEFLPCSQVLAYSEVFLVGNNDPLYRTRRDYG